MHVEIGPLPSEGVLVWLDYAVAVLSSEQGAPSPGDDVPPEVTDAFRGYIDDWREVATRSPDFYWKTDVPGEFAEYLILAFYRIVQRLAKAAEARGAPMSPPGSEAFYGMLVHGLLDALAEDGPGAAEFAEHLRSFWPGLED